MHCVWDRSVGPESYILQWRSFYKKHRSLPEWCEWYRLTQYYVRILFVDETHQKKKRSNISVDWAFLHPYFRHFNVISHNTRVAAEGTQCRMNFQTCRSFGPICRPSSGCNLTYRAATQDVWGVILGYWGGVGGMRSRCFNCGYHDLGLL